MKPLNYYLQGFGFKTTTDLTDSTFGHFLTTKALSFSLIFGIIKTFINDSLGFNTAVFSAFVFLNVLEYITGIKASRKRGETRESRKMGRMFLKVGTYLSIIWVLNSFRNGLQFPTVFGFELDPFIAFYWAFLAGVIYQLLISLGENLTQLGYKEMGGFLGFITRAFDKYFIKSNEKSTSTK